MKTSSFLHITDTHTRLSGVRQCVCSKEVRLGEQGWSRDGAVVRALASHQLWPGFDSRSRCHMWVEFVVGSRPLFVFQREENLYQHVISPVTLA